MGLPEWLFPVGIAEGRASPIVQWFYTRVPAGESIPWSAWIVPMIAWGVFAFAMLATLAALGRIIVDQWMDNERLPFPLTQVQTALIESPQPGRALNDLFRSRALWFGLITVFLVHTLNALSFYQPKYFPKIPLGFDFKRILSEPPWYYLPEDIKIAKFSFIVIGATYFIRTKAAFSLWAIFLIVGLFRMQQALTFGETPDVARQDQNLGACVAFAIGIAWIGRHHWARVFRNAIGRGAGGDRKYAASFWIATAGILIMLAWLRVVGVHLWMAAVIVLFILMAHLVVSRVLAETGLPFYRSMITTQQVYTNLSPALVSARDVFFAGVFSLLGPLTTRDGLMGYATTGLGVVKNSDVAEGERRRLGGAIVWTLLLGFAVAAAATLYCHYSYPTPLNREEVPGRNHFGSIYAPKRDVIDPFNRYANVDRYPAKRHDPATHMAIGFAITGMLEFASLRWASFPLLPVGFVTSHGSFMGNAWFSILIGWLAKVLIVRFGGSSLYLKAKPVFVGLIFGEGLAAGIFLIVNAIVVSSGGDIKNVQILL
jgi:hypothetical protein